MRHVLIRTIFLAFFICVSSSTAEAASLYIDPPFSELNRGDAVELSVRLDVDEQAGECVNAVDAVLTYSESIVPVDVSLGDSIFSMWVEQPTINKQDRTISFAGGMPNGYCGRVTGDPRLTNNLVKLIFRSPGFSIGGGDIDNSSAKVEFTDETTAYLNDGFGTQVVPQTYGASMKLSKNAGAGIVNPWQEEVNSDIIPPEEFSIFLRKGQLEFSGKYYISFNTTDKQTGVDEYQIMEEPVEQFGSFTWGRADAPWITARSPYILNDQSLNSIIRVRAIDKAGNEYVATLLPEESMRTISQNELTTYVVFGIIGLIVFGCLGVIVAYVIQRFRKKRKVVSDDMLETEDQGEVLDTDNEYEEYDK